MLFAVVKEKYVNWCLLWEWAHVLIPRVNGVNNVLLLGNFHGDHVAAFYSTF